MAVEDAEIKAQRVVRECMKDERTIQRIWEFAQLRPLDVVNHADGVHGIEDYTLGVVEQYGLVRVYISTLERVCSMRRELFWSRVACVVALAGWAWCLWLLASGR